jgi:hypothetical protein
MALLDNSQPTTPGFFRRGNPGNPGEEVPRQFLEMLAGPGRQPFTQGSGRLEMARAIASRGNPLTARVWVNRVWMYHFGAPLVRTPSDFGVRSEPPTHPELLDFLAARFMEEGWSVKKLHRQIMLSAAYQQSSGQNPKAAAVDPANELLWRMNRHRLDFESMRDTFLAVSAGSTLRPAATPWTSWVSRSARAGRSMDLWNARTCPACSAPSTLPVPTPPARSDSPPPFRNRHFF